MMHHSLDHGLDKDHKECSVVTSASHIPDRFLPNGIAQLTIYPSPHSMERVIAVDLPLATVRKIEQYSPDLSGLSQDELYTLREDAYRANPIDRELLKRIDNADAFLELRAREQIRAGGPATLRYPGVLSGRLIGTGFAVTVAISAYLTMSLPWSFIVACLGIVSGFGLSQGISRVVNKREGETYQEHKSLVDENRQEFISLTDTNDESDPVEAVVQSSINSINSISSALAELRAVGLDTGDLHAHAVAALGTVLRSVATVHQKAARSNASGEVLGRLSLEEIEQDPDLAEVHRKHQQDLLKLNAAVDNMIDADTELTAIDDQASSDALRAKAQLRAARYNAETGGGDD